PSPASPVSFLFPYTTLFRSRGLFQLGFTFYVIEMTCQVAVAALWYVVLRPVSKPMALTAAFIELSGCIVKSFARVLYIAPLWVLDRKSTRLNSSHEWISYAV